VADGDGAGGARIDIGAFELQTAAPTLLGDYNDDGSVDAADYVVYRKHAGTSTPLPNDAIGGVIGAAHLNQWKANFGNTLPPGAGGGMGTGEVVNQVVEPTANSVPVQKVRLSSAEFASQPLKSPASQTPKFVGQLGEVVVQSAEIAARQALPVARPVLSVPQAAANIANEQMADTPPETQSTAGSTHTDQPEPIRASVGIDGDNWRFRMAGRSSTNARVSAQRELDTHRRDQALAAWLSSRAAVEVPSDRDGQLQKVSDERGETFNTPFEAVDTVFEELLVVVVGI
jgi:hypothetical protein